MQWLASIPFLQSYDGAQGIWVESEEVIRVDGELGTAGREEKE